MCTDDTIGQSRAVAHWRAVPRGGSASRSGPSGDSPKREQQLLELLAAAGVSGAAAQAVLETGRALRDRSRTSSDERAAMISKRTGRRLGRVLRGEPNGVDISEHIEALVPDHPYVQLHTHPSAPSPSLSERDAFNVVGVAQIEATVVGADDAWYVLSRWGEFEGPRNERERQLRLREVFDAFWNELRRLKPRFDALVDAGTLDQGEARHHLTHQVWERIAVRLGLRYDRVDAPGTERE